MKKLLGVTISGADDETDLNDLASLSLQFPFVEWAILASPNNYGKPRYPSQEWIKGFLNRETQYSNSALHICGDYARTFAQRRFATAVDRTKLFDLMQGFDRVQINASSWIREIDVNYLSDNIQYCDNEWFILQLKDDGPKATEIFDAITDAAKYKDEDKSVRIYPFLDGSGGRGIEAPIWKMDLNFNGVRGYAGGINPVNVEGIIKNISDSLPDDARFWIDMESGVRIDDHFDINLVQHVLSICEPYYSNESGIVVS